MRFLGAYVCVCKERPSGLLPWRERGPLTPPTNFDKSTTHNRSALEYVPDWAGAADNAGHGGHSRSASSSTSDSGGAKPQKERPAAAAAAAPKPKQKAPSQKAPQQQPPKPVAPPTATAAVGGQQEQEEGEEQGRGPKGMVERERDSPVDDNALVAQVMFLLLGACGYYLPLAPLDHHLALPHQPP